MKSEQQRIVIAELCGWKPLKYEKPPKGTYIFEPHHFRRWKKSKTSCETANVDDLPDYPNDLNAMADAEKVLTDEQFYDFRQNLKQITHHSKIFVEEHKRAVISATATQRAEAFLRTLERWEE